MILSIENHCSIEQQKVMAQHLNHILGSALLKSALDGKGVAGLPSPEVRHGRLSFNAHFGSKSFVPRGVMHREAVVGLLAVICDASVNFTVETVPQSATQNTHA